MSDIGVEHHGNDHKEGYQPTIRINDVAQKFLDDLEQEKKRVNQNDFPLCAMLIDEAVQRIYSTGRIPGREFYADVYKQKPMKLSQKVFVPVKQYPKFNFVGKILGPKGNSLRRLQEETQCRIEIKGRNSMRDRSKEEDLRSSGDPRYMHLNKDLYVEVSTVSTPAESYARVAYALAEIRKFIIPDKNDDVSHDQLRELMEIDPSAVKHMNGNAMQMNKSILESKMNSGSKYLGLIKHTAVGYEEEEGGEPEQYEYRNTKQSNNYEYSKAHSAMTPSASYKRTQAVPYVPETKRLREAAPFKPYSKPTSYAVLKKYK